MEIPESLLERPILTGFISLLLGVILMAGCATDPSTSSVQPWPDSPPDGYAMFLMYCNQNTPNGPQVSIDDTPAFKISGSSFTWVYIKEGQHRIRTKWFWSTRGLNLEDKITFSAGKSYYVMLLVAKDGNPYVTEIRTAIRPVSEQTARKEAAPCQYRKPFVFRIDTTTRQSPDALTVKP